MENKNEYMKIKEAAQFLKVTTTTLRNWDKQGKFKPYRHPMNNYRLYEKEELEQVFKRMEESK